MRKLVGDTLAEIGGWIPIALMGVNVIAFFDWLDYHARGKSAFVGLNPRCVIRFGDCSKLDTDNLPWDAALAVWIDGWFWWAFIAACLGAYIAAYAVEHLRR